MDTAIVQGEAGIEASRKVWKFTLAWENKRFNIGPCSVVSSRGNLVRKGFYMTFDPTQPSHRRFRQILKERTTPVVVWAGAGLSASAELPTWPDLLERLLEIGEAKLRTLDAAAQRVPKNLLNLAQAESSMWLAFDHLRRALGDTTWTSSIRTIFESSLSARIPEMYLDLWGLQILTGWSRARFQTAFLGEPFVSLPEINANSTVMCYVPDANSSRIYMALWIMIRVGFLRRGILRGFADCPRTRLLSKRASHPGWFCLRGFLRMTKQLGVT
jgi:hypothetical protein